MTERTSISQDRPEGVQTVGQVAALAMRAMRECFKPGVAITVLVRAPEGDMAVFAATDEEALTDVIPMIQRLQAKGGEVF